uniref:Uncharacterized protein n=1 Tax=Oryza brachyantha TaxID=4533 RepID=J3N899_ORYBR
MFSSGLFQFVNVYNLGKDVFRYKGVTTKGSRMAQKHGMCFHSFLAFLVYSYVSLLFKCIRMDISIFGCITLYGLMVSGCNYDIKYLNSITLKVLG